MERGLGDRLVEAAVAGDESAFGELFERHRGEVRKSRGWRHTDAMAAMFAAGGDVRRQRPHRRADRR